MIVLKPTEFLKAKYTSRKRGKDGKWIYTYDRPATHGTLRGVSAKTASGARKEADAMRRQEAKYHEGRLQADVDARRNHMTSEFGIDPAKVDALKGKGASDDKMKISSYVQEHKDLLARRDKFKARKFSVKDIEAKIATKEKQINRLKEKWGL